MFALPNMLWSLLDLSEALLGQRAMCLCHASTSDEADGMAWFGRQVSVLAFLQPLASTGTGTYPFIRLGAVELGTPRSFVHQTRVGRFGIAQPTFVAASAPCSVSLRHTRPLLAFDSWRGPLPSTAAVEGMGRPNIEVRSTCARRTSLDKVRA